MSIRKMAPLSFVLSFAHVVFRMGPKHGPVCIAEKNLKYGPYLSWCFDKVRLDGFDDILYVCLHDGHRVPKRLARLATMGYYTILYYIILCWFKMIRYGTICCSSILPLAYSTETRLCYAVLYYNVLY